MSEIEKIVIGEKTYSVQRLSVLDTIYFHAEAMHLLGDAAGKILDVYIKAHKKGSMDFEAAGNALARIEPEAIRIIQPKILKQVITPENKFLDNEMTIEEWFSKPENAADVWEVTIKAGAILLGKYLPRFLQEMVEPMKAAVKTMAPESSSPIVSAPKL